MSLEATGTETCPECRGTPEHTVIMCSDNGCRETVEACKLCGGLGLVEIAIAARHRKGHELLDVRVHGLGFTQREAGHVFGLDWMQIHEIECGRADAPLEYERRLRKLAAESTQRG